MNTNQSPLSKLKDPTLLKTDALVNGEWVVLLAGEALLRFEDESEARRLRAGDWLLIEAMRRHRVEWTTPATPTVWLAVHHAQG